MAKELTIYDIAKKAKVSPATVSRALNKKYKNGSKRLTRVSKIINDLAWTPNFTARNLSRMNN